MAALQQFGDANTIYGFALGATTWSQAYINQLIATSAGLVAPVINPAFPTIPTPPVPVSATLPTFLPISWSVPSPPDPFNENLDVSGLLPPPFTGVQPTLSFPGQPAGFTETAPDSPAINLSYTWPTLSLNLPSPPNLLSISISPFSGMTLPTAPGDPSELTLAAPSVVAYVPGAPYTSALLTQLETKLQSWLTSATDTGLPANVETALWDRGREREARSMRDKFDALDQMEALGYSMPPGAFLDARTKIYNEAMANEVGLSREIMIKQAELHLQNIGIAMQHTVALESKLIDYANEIEQRNFEATKYATEAGIAIYNARVQAYAAYLEAYKTKAAIYEAEIRAEIAKVDAYKAQVEAERAKAEVNQALVEQYHTMAEVALSAVEVYKAELGAIQTMAEIEKTKVEVYGEQIKAYVGKINAYTANIEAYKAAVQAEGTKQEAFASAVRAYAAEVDAAAKIAEAQIEAFKGRIAAKQAEYEGYKAIVTAEAAHAEATAKINEVTAETFKAQVSSISAYNELLTKQWAAIVDQNERIAEVAINTAKMNAELYITTRQLAAEGAKVGAQVSAQLASAALNAIHWSSSVSQSYSESNSNSSSVSDNTNTNYNYTV